MATLVTQPDALLKQMASLADLTRLRLLRLLEKHELGVAELCDVLQMPQSTVSRHLKVLGDEGWVVSRRSGTTNLYRMILDELDDPARQLWLLARDQTESWATVRQDQVRLVRRLQSRKDEAQRFFADVAHQWASRRQDLYGSAFMNHAVVSLLPSDWVVADLGCGTGDFASRVAGAVKTVIGVDSSPAMLEAARQSIAGRKNIDLREGDLEDLPIDDGACDAATMLLVLTYVPNPDKALAEMARVIRPGGKAVVVDLMRHDREEFRREHGQHSLGFESAELAKMLQKAGFKTPRCEPLPPEPDTKGPALLLAGATRG